MSVKMTVFTQGVAEIQRKLGAISKDVNGEIRDALIAAAFRIQRTAKKSIQKSPPDPDTGRSKPGNPPKTDRGVLVNSIFVNVEQSGIKPIVTVGTNLKYGAWLEFGTKDTAARPWLAPAHKANKDVNVREISKAVFRVVAAYGKRGTG